MGETRNTNKALVGKPEEKISLGDVGIGGRVILQ
jgi:hypothetical protein